jgi:hypothetical protein
MFILFFSLKYAAKVQKNRDAVNKSARVMKIASFQEQAAFSDADSFEAVIPHRPKKFPVRIAVSFYRKRA